MAQGQATEPSALQGVATALVGFRGEQRKVALAAIERRLVPDILPRRMQELLDCRGQLMPGCGRRRRQDQRPPCHRAADRAVRREITALV